MATRSYDATRRKGAARLPIGRRSLLRNDSPNRAARLRHPIEPPTALPDAAASPLPSPAIETAQPPEESPTPPPALNLQSERTVSVKEAAYRLGKSEDAVRLWLRQGRLKGWQPGGRGCAILVAEASLERALACSV